MTAFLDSSAIVKLYVDEEHHPRVRELAPAYVVSALARVEVPAALWRKARIKELSSTDAVLLANGFEDDLLAAEADSRRFEIVPVTPPVLDRAAALVAVHPLRAFDGVQLASALLVDGLHESEITFVSFDRALNAAAEAEGLPIAVA